MGKVKSPHILPGLGYFKDPTLLKLRGLVPLLLGTFFIIRFLEEKKKRQKTQTAIFFSQYTNNSHFLWKIAQ